MRLKNHESPRKRGRNKKGKLASARLRQLKKRDKMLKNKLKKNSEKGSSFCIREVHYEFIACSLDYS